MFLFDVFWGLMSENSMSVQGDNMISRGNVFDDNNCEKNRGFFYHTPVAEIWLGFLLSCVCILFIGFSCFGDFTNQLNVSNEKSR